MFLTSLLTIPIIVFIPIFGLLSSHSRKNRIESHVGYTFCFTLLCGVATYIYIGSKMFSQTTSNYVFLIILWIITGMIFVLELVVMIKMKHILIEKFETNMIILFEKSQILDKLNISFIASLLKIDEKIIQSVLKEKSGDNPEIEISFNEVILPTKEAKRNFIKIVEENFRP